KRYHLEHNFGHGKKKFSAVLVALNLQVFAMHTVYEIMDELWRLARQKHGSRSQFFSSMAAVTAFLLFPS
ncbi:MAG: ISNCY family transposase, partial [Alphaproteobacteria bacterium]